jgi:hypothetical protein
MEGCDSVKAFNAYAPSMCLRRQIYWKISYLHILNGYKTARRKVMRLQSDTQQNCKCRGASLITKWAVHNASCVIL